MVKVEDESRAPVEGRCGNILGCGVVDGDGDGGEEFHGVEIAGNGTVSGTIAGSVSGEGGFSAEKPIHEASEDPRTLLPLMCQILQPSFQINLPSSLAGKFASLMESHQKRFKKSSVSLLLLNPLRQRTPRA